MDSQKRLFLASFITLIAAGVGFSIRSGILDDWGRQFGFTQTELGAITGSGLWVFGIAIVLFSLIADRVGYGKLMVLAFVLHVLAAVSTLSATFLFAHHGKAAAYWALYAGMSLFSLANGTCETVINPLIATLYPKEKTHYLNVLQRVARRINCGRPALVSHGRNAANTSWCDGKFNGSCS
jgi:MFS family permease